MKDDALHKTLLLRIDALEGQLEESRKQAANWCELWDKASRERDVMKRKGDIEDEAIEHILGGFRDEIFNAFAPILKELKSRKANDS